MLKLSFFPICLLGENNVKGSLRFQIWPKRFGQKARKHLIFIYKKCKNKKKSILSFQIRTLLIEIKKKKLARELFLYNENYECKFN